MSSRWYGEPGEFAMHKTRMSTVGVLVYLDGSSPFRSWDGDMVRALVCFSVDGRLVRVATGPVPQAPSAAALSVPAVTGGAVAPQVQQATVYGPPPPPPTSPTRDPARRRPQASTAAGASAAAGAPSAAMVVGDGTQQRREEGQGGGGGMLSPSSGSPPVEEIAPWEIAAASAAATAAAAAAAVHEAHLAGGGGGGGGEEVVGRAAPSRGVSRVVAPAAVPETSAALGLALPKDRDLFPTVTIHSANTEVSHLDAFRLFRVLMGGGECLLPAGSVAYRSAVCVVRSCKPLRQRRVRTRAAIARVLFSKVERTRRRERMRHRCMRLYMRTATDAPSLTMCNLTARLLNRSCAASAPKT